MRTALAVVGRCTRTRHRSRITGSHAERLRLVKEREGISKSEQIRRAVMFDAERPEQWREWARRFAAALDVAEALHQGKTTPESAVRAFVEPADHFDADNTRDALLGRGRFTALHSFTAAMTSCRARRAAVSASIVCFHPSRSLAVRGASRCGSMPVFAGEY